MLRRILRRAVRYGRTLGFHEPFFYKLVDVLAETMDNVFPEIRAKQKHVRDVIRTEEEAFNRTLDRGLEFFEDYTEAGGIYSPCCWWSACVHGEWAFTLYDTYGFPLRPTELLARERGMTVDKDGFETFMDLQRHAPGPPRKRPSLSFPRSRRRRPRSSSGSTSSTPGQGARSRQPQGQDRRHPRHQRLLRRDGRPGRRHRQVGARRELWRVTNTQKSGNTWLHFLEEGARASRPLPLSSRRRVPLRETRSQATETVALPNPISRCLPRAARCGCPLTRPAATAIQRHHTVTHLLHWALHEVVSKDASQKGSFVGPDKLTFDFNSAPLTPQQVARR